jgi:ectoine hydroxylase-related dioxygenase (phytanoyl-CoA dioxygenase family)
MATLAIEGYSTLKSDLDSETLSNARNEIFESGAAGVRCLLDHRLVSRIAVQVGCQLIAAGLLPKEAEAVQTIAFDKTPAANWKVTWHQDVMFPFLEKTRTPGFDLPSIKDGINFSRPPVSILENMLAVRLHLDSCDASNGPLRVSPGSHRYGFLKSFEIPKIVAQQGDVAILAELGELILMKPLLLHASSKALTARHRRVLHFVFHSGQLITERWHCAIGMPAESIESSSRS